MMKLELAEELLQKRGLGADLKKLRHSESE